MTWYQSGSVIVLLLHWVTAFSKVNKLQRLWRNYFSQYLWHSFQQTEPNVSKLQVNDELTEREGLSWLRGERWEAVPCGQTGDDWCDGGLSCPASRHPVALPSLPAVISSSTPNIDISCRAWCRLTNRGVSRQLSYTLHRTWSKTDYLNMPNIQRPLWWCAAPTGPGQGGVSSAAPSHSTLEKIEISPHSFS